MKALIAELNDYLAHHEAEFRAVAAADQRAYIISKLGRTTPSSTLASPLR